MTETALLSGLRANKPAVIQYFIKKNWPYVRQMVTRSGGSVEEAEDVWMDTMEVLFIKLNKPDFELSASVSTLAIAICRYKWLNTLKRKKKFSPLEVTNSDLIPLIESADIQIALELQERNNIYRKHWANLGEPCKQLLSLAFEGLSIAQIATSLGISSEAYTRKRKHECKEKLIRSIKNDPDFKHL